MKATNLFLLIIITLIQCTCAKDIPQYQPASALFIDSLYKDVNGFDIPEQERTKITQVGGAPTYGEITFDGLKTLLEFLNLKQNDLFYDLGSGVGKVVVQVYLTTPVKKAVGIELSTTRLKAAQKTFGILKRDGFVNKGRSIEFREQDIVDTDMSDATVVFMCSLCFSDELLQRLLQKCLKLKKGARIVTLRRFTPVQGIKLIKDMTLPMTWSTATPVYIYEVVQPRAVPSKPKPKPKLKK